MRASGLGASACLALAPGGSVSLKEEAERAHALPLPACSFGDVVSVPGPWPTESVFVKARHVPAWVLLREFSRAFPWPVALAVPDGDHVAGGARHGTCDCADGAGAYDSA